MLTRGQLIAIMPRAGAAAERFLDPLNAAMARFGIDTAARQGAFLAQLAHESGQLQTLEENLNYGWEGLRKVFGKYFVSDDDAKAFARQKERIANRVYAGRMGNGDEASGDGWRYRGRGPIQLTGRENYRRCGQAIGIDIEGEPDRLATDPVAAALAAAWYWSDRKINSAADRETDAGFKQVTKLINGGLVGLADRVECWNRARRALGLALVPVVVPRVFELGVTKRRAAPGKKKPVKARAKVRVAKPRRPKAKTTAKAKAKAKAVKRAPTKAARPRATKKAAPKRRARTLSRP